MPDSPSSRVCAFPVRGPRHALRWALRGPSWRRVPRKTWACTGRCVREDTTSLGARGSHGSWLEVLQTSRVARVWATAHARAAAGCGLSRVRPGHRPSRGLGPLRRPPSPGITRMRLRRFPRNVTQRHCVQRGGGRSGYPSLLCDPAGNEVLDTPCKP